MKDAHDGSEIAKLAKMIHGIRTAMLTTAERDGGLHARPMATQQVEFDGTLWFFTQVHSEKVDDLERNAQVNVAYADEPRSTYVSMSGTAELVRDKAKMKELYTPILKAWFKDGLDDPNLALIKVTVESAQYWDQPSSRLVRLVGLAKSALTGAEYRQGEQGTVELSH